MARNELSGLKASTPTPILGFALSAAGFTVCRGTGAEATSSATWKGGRDVAVPGSAQHAWDPGWPGRQPVRADHTHLVRGRKDRMTLNAAGEGPMEARL